MLNGQFSLILTSAKTGQVMAIVKTENGRLAEVTEPNGYQYSPRGRGVDAIPQSGDTTHQGIVFLNLRQFATTPHFHYQTVDGVNFHLTEATDGVPTVTGTAQKV